MNAAPLDAGAGHTSARHITPKYFFFSTLDDAQTFSLSVRALNELKAKNWFDPVHRAEWVRTLFKWKQKIGRVSATGWSGGSQQPGFVLPPQLDLVSWSTFISTCNPDEVEAVLLSRILKFSDLEIARGLDVTVGTVRYRVGRGLRQLGALLDP